VQASSWATRSSIPLRSTAARQPDIAYDPIADRFLVAWQNGALRARAVSRPFRRSSTGTPTGAQT
jgi:hypothetical protein